MASKARGNIIKPRRTTVKYAPCPDHDREAAPSKVQYIKADYHWRSTSTSMYSERIATHPLLTYHPGASPVPDVSTESITFWLPFSVWKHCFHVSVKHGPLPYDCGACNNSSRRPRYDCIIGILDSLLRWPDLPEKAPEVPVRCFSASRPSLS